MLHQVKTQHDAVSRVLSGDIRVLTLNFCFVELKITAAEVKACDMCDGFHISSRHETVYCLKPTHRTVICL